MKVELRDKLIEALERGPIWAVGGMVFDADGVYLFSTSDLSQLKDIVPIRRTDAGGRPTWVGATTTSSEED